MKRFLPLIFFHLLLFEGVFAQKWTHVQGPDGGNNIQIDPDDNWLYLLTGAGIYRSADDGYHWSLLEPTITQTYKALQMQVERGAIYLIDFYEPFGRLSRIKRSKDGGQTWELRLVESEQLTYPDEYLQTIYADADVLLAGSTHGIYRSVDQGDSWQVALDIPVVPYAKPAPKFYAFGHELFAVFNAAIYRSSDAGQTWKVVCANQTGFATALATEHFLYVLSEQKDTLLKSADGFRSWAAIATDTLAKFNVTDNPTPILIGDDQHLYSIDHNYGCGFRLCSSQDGGISWQRESVGPALLDGAGVRTVWYNNAHILLATNELYHSTDQAKSFSKGPDDINNASVTRILAQNHRIHVVTQDRKDYYTADEGITWQPHLPTPDKSAYCYAGVQLSATQKRLFRVLENPDAYYYSEDGGQTWVELPNLAGNNFTTAHAYWWYNNDFQNNGWRVRFYRLSDDKIGIDTLDIPDYRPWYEFSWAWGADEKVIFYYNLSDTLLLLDEKAGLLEEIGVMPCNPPVSLDARIFFDGEAPIYVCGDRVFIYLQDLREWKEIYPQDWTTGQPLYHSRFTFIKKHEGLIWIGVWGKGLFYAPDYSGRFYPVTPQLPSPYPTDIAFDAGKIWVGTGSAGIYTLPLSEIQTAGASRAHFQLFPNPSSGELRLSSDVFMTEETNLTLLDAAGRLIGEKTLFPGQYWEMEFPGLPKGLYFLHLKNTLGYTGLKWMIQ